MKNLLLASGILSLVLSAAEADGEVILPLPEVKTICGKWIGEVQTCEEYYNGKKTSGITQRYRDKYLRIDFIRYAADGTDFNEAVKFRYDDHSRIDEMEYYLAGELRRRYVCSWNDRGIKTKETVYNDKEKPLYEAQDDNQDGRMEMITRSRYGRKGKLMERTLDEDGDGKIDADWDLEEWKWVKRPVNPPKKVYIKGY